MFSDHAKIHVAGGRGGNGCLSFRREKHVPRGGPDGGDGGRGGDVVVVAHPQLRDLSPFARRIHYKAEAGRHGQGSRKDGARGADLEVEVPLGTQVWRDGVLIADLTAPGERVAVAPGGRGGRGNARFVASTRQAPAFAEQGDEGEASWIELSLKLMADVGLAGLPNAGKSSLLRRVSNAEPKVADYPFTTVEPLLGVVDLPGEELTFTVADVPGLLEGAGEGVGLGHEFLAHLERCHLILHVIDVTGYYGAEPLDNFGTILRELDAHTPELGRKPQVIVLNKADAIGARERAELRAVFAAEIQRLRREGHPAFSWERQGEKPASDQMVWLISAVSGEGIPALLRWVGGLVRARVSAVMEEGAPGGGAVDGVVSASPPWFDSAWASEAGLAAQPGHVVYRPVPTAGLAFRARREGDHFVVEGEAIVRIVRRYDLENAQAVRYLGERLERLGVYRALSDLGAAPGDEVHIGEFVFEYE